MYGNIGTNLMQKRQRGGRGYIQRIYCYGKNSHYHSLQVLIILNIFIAFTISGSLAADLKQVSATESQQKNTALYNEAIDDYFNRKYNKASLVFGLLTKSGNHAELMIPMALNKIAMHDHSSAEIIFDKIILKNTPRDTDYAILWKILILKKSNRIAELKNIQKNIIDHMWLYPHENAIADMLLGAGDIKNVLNVIDDVQQTPATIRGDALTESVWFIYSYYLDSGYTSKAFHFLQKNIEKLNSKSLEYRLLQDAYAYAKVENHE